MPDRACPRLPSVAAGSAGSPGAGTKGGWCLKFRLGNSHDEGPGVRPGANVHKPIILGSIDDESPDTVARMAARQPKSVRR